MTAPKLALELLNGPLDGCIILLNEELILGAKGEGPLTFPWDLELGEPQARFFTKEGQWWLEGYPARHGTYRLNSQERIEEPVQLEAGDVLKASEVCLIVRQVEQG